MLLREMFEQADGGGVVQGLRDSILDMLMPLAAQGVPYVTVQAIVDKMKELDSGVSVDRALVMHVLDPQDVKMVSKIEGDRVYFGLSQDEDQNKAGPDAAEKNADKVSSMAMSQAKTNLKKQNGVAPEPNPGEGPLS
jgi:hypothetical protein